MYFATKTWVTLVNKNTTLELTFVFNTEEWSTYFETEHLHSFIESDLNVSGLWRYFTPNKVARAELYNQCLEELLKQDTIQKKDGGFVILNEEEY